MKSRINLASLKKKETVHRSLLLPFVISIFGVLVLVTIGLMLYLFSVRTSLNNLADEEVVLIGQINKNNQARANALILKDRLSNITKIIDSRESVNKKAATLLALLSDQLQITRFSLKDNSANIDLSSNNLSAFNQFIESDIRRLENEKATGITRADIQSFGIGKGSVNYVMRVNFVFNK